MQNQAYKIRAVCLYIYDIYICRCIMYVLNAKPEIHQKLFYLFLGIGFMI